MRIDGIASVADILLGAWLLFSMVFWTRSPDQMANTGAVGLFAVALGALAYFGRTWARWIVAALGVWLFCSVWALPGRTTGLVVNSMLIGTLLFGFSALPTGRGMFRIGWPGGAP
ncbi:MAG: hypothetical protein KF764_26835 [Labilithrix sp.]|nr:hypothetical protein [Labilithrix sp.]